ncbi:hypothetical protein V8E54_011969 [Elaphomyces granulatus]
MKVSIVSIIVAILLAASSAAPVDTGKCDICLIFHGPRGSSFTQCFPNYGEPEPVPIIEDPYNIEVPPSTVCAFYWSDKTTSLIINGGNLPVNPPPTLNAVACHRFEPCIDRFFFPTSL